MEVDTIFSSPGQNSEARHASPYAGPAASSSQTLILNQAYGSRKRRRSSRLNHFSRSPSDEGRTAGSVFALEDESADDDGIGSRLAKRRREVNLISKGDQQSSHHFRSLGSASALTSHPHDNEYGVDSPMYSLSLTSPSPPPDLNLDHLAEDDVDMGDGEDLRSPTSTPASSSASHLSPPLIPRQVKAGQYQRINSTAPLRPSPLVHSEKFVSSSTQGSPSSSQALTSSQSMNSIYPAQNDHTQDTSPSRRDSPHLMRKALHQSSSRESDSPDTSDRRKMTEPSRTPSPGPILISTDAAYGEGRKLHHSPGLSQTSFPGGKQLLRYTMGYREDCSACKSKTPGHYGHVMHH